MTTEPRSSNGGKAEAKASPGKLPRKKFDKELRKLQRELVIIQEYVKAMGSRSSSSPGPRRGRQGRRDQAHRRAHEPACVPGRGASRADRAGEDPVVLPAVRATSPPPARSSSSIAPGTTGRASSG